MANLSFHLEQECQAHHTAVQPKHMDTYTHFHCLHQNTLIRPAVYPWSNKSVDCSLYTIYTLFHKKKTKTKKHLNYASKSQINAFNLLRNWYAIQWIFLSVQFRQEIHAWYSHSLISIAIYHCRWYNKIQETEEIGGKC